MFRVGDSTSVQKTPFDKSAKALFHTFAQNKQLTFDDCNQLKLITDYSTTNLEVQAINQRSSHFYQEEKENLVPP